MEWFNKMWLKYILKNDWRRANTISRRQKFMVLAIEQRGCCFPDYAGWRDKITISTQNGLDDCEIDLVQYIEQQLDKVMVRNGFTRTTTTKAGGRLEFNYRQFAKALDQ